MRFGKILLMGLMAACLMGASSRAWDEGNTICPGDGGAEAEQIRIFIKNWKEVYPMGGEPVREFAVTDLDGNGLLEILVRPPESEDIPVVYEVTPDHDGLKREIKNGIAARFPASPLPGSSCIRKQRRVPGQGILMTLKRCCRTAMM